MLALPAAVHDHDRRTDIEPKAVSAHWYRYLCALGIRQRRLCTKDTFVTTALQLPALKIPWLEAQAGVNYVTLRRHYRKWIPRSTTPIATFASIEPGLFGGRIAPRREGKGRNSCKWPKSRRRRSARRGT